MREIIFIKEKFKLKFIKKKGLYRAFIMLSCIVFLLVQNSMKDVQASRLKAPAPLVGTSIEGRKYTYDAAEIARRLNEKDFKSPNEKIVFLTFDDGPSITNTPKVLDILKEKGVKATFFIVGENLKNGGKRTEAILKRTLDEGHAIGNHSWTHDYKILYPEGTLDAEAFIKEYKQTDELLKQVLGNEFSTRIIRCPGGCKTWKGMDRLDEYLKASGRYKIDWDALTEDAEGEKKTAEELVNYAIETSKGKDIVVLLMHDAYNKEETVKALPQIIDYFKAKGYTFKSIA